MPPPALPNSWARHRLVREAASRRWGKRLRRQDRHVALHACSCQPGQPSARSRSHPRTSLPAQGPVLTARALYWKKIIWRITVLLQTIFICVALVTSSYSPIQNKRTAALSEGWNTFGKICRLMARRFSTDVKYLG